MPTLLGLERRTIKLEHQMKKIFRFLEMVPVVNPARLRKLDDLDLNIIKHLIGASYEGCTTTEIARALKIPKPEGYGRCKVYRRLIRIATLSRRSKGQSFVLTEKKRWLMNWNDFNFGPIPEVDDE